MLKCVGAFCLLLWLNIAQAEIAPQKVTLQLKWFHAFQFAGYYAAQEKGYYREVGLDVEIREAEHGERPIERVLRGEAQFGVGTSGLLLARHAGKPVVALAAIFQHSPLVLIAAQPPGPQTSRNLAGKRIMIEPQSEELIAYIKQQGIADTVTLRPHTFRLRDLVDGNVDAISAYATNEPYFLDRLGFAYEIYTPRNANIDFYGDNLFTSEQELKQHPQRVQAFLEASLRGWRYAMAHQDEIARLIAKHYSKRYNVEFLRFEAAQMANLMRQDLIEIGYMSPGRWRHIADTYANLGLLPPDVPLDGFLYKPTPRIETHLTSLYIAAGVVILISGVALYILRINCRLAQALASSQEAEQALRVSEERHRMLADNATDVIWTMDLAGRFTYVSPSVEKLRGYTPAEVMKQSIEEALTPESAVIARTGLERILRALQNGEPEPDFRGELEQPCKGGGTVWTDVTTTMMRNAAGEFVGILGVTRDITARRKVEERVRHMAQHDMLTGLPNRALFSDRLQQAFARAKRDNKRLAIMFIDLDQFKPVNDTYGHATGDLLLVEVAKRMQTCVRGSDTVARIGGDEFVVLLATVETDRNALAVAQKIHASLKQPFRLAGQVLHISSCIGVAIYPEHGSTEIELSKRADSAMYQIKKCGRDDVRLYQA
ncbi:diguanylate cyclase [Chitinivorax sp. B]|uniref:diguanylate cyclase domain-containing protein n=1 Tax=Chitinivorax sp. B TaxID=2502235 RepID=UPI0010F8E4E0|nr:diguanylate cyclase [Chitinivorax sp. B]